MMATNGGISLSDLLKLPVRQLNVLRKAVDIERIGWRKQFIHDVASAFGDPQKGMGRLDEVLRRLNSDIGVSNVIWTPEEDAANKLARWMR
jgi:hypothetical protein